MRTARWRRPYSLISIFCFAQVLDGDPTSSAALFRRGWAHAAMGDYALAMGEMEVAMLASLLPGQLQIVQQLALAEHSLAARDAAQQVRRMSCHSSEAMRGLGFNAGSRVLNLAAARGLPAAMATDASALRCRVTGFWVRRCRLSCLPRISGSCLRFVVSNPKMNGCGLIMSLEHILVQSTIRKPRSPLELWASALASEALIIINWLVRRAVLQSLASSIPAWSLQSS